MVPRGLISSIKAAFSAVNSSADSVISSCGFENSVSSIPSEDWSLFFSIRNSVGANKFISPAAVLWPSMRPESPSSRGTVVRFSDLRNRAIGSKGDARHERLPYVIARQIFGRPNVSVRDSGELPPPIQKVLWNFQRLSKQSASTKQQTQLQPLPPPRFALIPMMTALE